MTQHSTFKSGDGLREPLETHLPFAERRMFGVYTLPDRREFPHRYPDEGQGADESPSRSFRHEQAQGLRFKNPFLPLTNPPTVVVGVQAGAAAVDVNLPDGTWAIHVRASSAIGLGIGGQAVLPTTTPATTGTIIVGTGLGMYLTLAIKRLSIIAVTGTPSVSIECWTQVV